MEISSNTFGSRFIFRGVPRLFADDPAQSDSRCGSTYFVRRGCFQRGYVEGRSSRRFCSDESTRCYIAYGAAALRHQAGPGETYGALTQVLQITRPVLESMERRKISFY
jgi:hypothetical protein